jgi:hypothetical protein
MSGLSSAFQEMVDIAPYDGDFCLHWLLASNSEKVEK